MPGGTECPAPGGPTGGGCDTDSRKPATNPTPRCFPFPFPCGFVVRRDGLGEHLKTPAEMGTGFIPFWSSRRFLRHKRSFVQV